MMDVYADPAVDRHFSREAGLAREARLAARSSRDEVMEIQRQTARCRAMAQEMRQEREMADGIFLSRLQVEALRDALDAALSAPKVSA